MINEHIEYVAANNHRDVRSVITKLHHQGSVGNYVPVYFIC